MIEFIREGDLCQVLKVSSGTALKIRNEDSTFPAMRTLYGDVRGWLSNELEEWLLNRPVGDPRATRNPKGRKRA